MTARPSRLLLFLATAAAALAQSAAPPAQVPSPPSAIDPRSFPGADIGAQVNAALRAMPESGGTVRIPAGSYTFATTMRLPHAGYHLQCDAGAVLHYTGTGDALLLEPSGDLGALSLTVDGEGGCLLLGNPRAVTGIRITPSNSTIVAGMRIRDFPHGNGISLTGANSVQILRNTITRTAHGIDMVTVPHYAPNEVHVAFNEIADNDWAVYSHDGHVAASRALGNVYRDNVFEANHSGDLFLAWEAHTVVEGNYFESNGVGVAAGTGDANVYDVHIARNYFTTGAYRSEIELGYGFGFFIEQNYQEGPKGALTGCDVNAAPGPNGGVSGVVLQNAFARTSERATSPHEFCYRGSPTIPDGVLGTTRMTGGLDVDGTLHARGAQLDGPLLLDSKAGKPQVGEDRAHSMPQIRATETAVQAGDPCTPEGTLLISTPAGQSARLLFCSSAHWQAVSLPRP